MHSTQRFKHINVFDVKYLAIIKLFNILLSAGSNILFFMESNQKLITRISALEKENADLKEASTIFKTIFESSRLGNKIINSDLKILEVNAALIELLGYTSKNDLVGSKIIDYTPEDRRTDWRVLQEKLWSNAAPSFSLETCLIRRDGSIIWCQITSILISTNGETLGYTIIEDVSEQRALRIQKAQFISVASHELKTPITSLNAITQLMSRQLKVGTPVTERLHKLARDSDRQVTRLVHLVDALLSSTRLEQGQLSINKSTFVLADMVDGCCSHIQMEGEYHLVFEGDRATEVFADDHKIEQVLVNLINNAVKYAHLSTEIIVRLESKKGFVKVSVIDHGAGIPEESLPKLFDRYYRVHQNNNKPGLGLGLYISAEIINRHGGEMGVNSTPGEGSTFWFTLPDRP